MAIQQIPIEAVIQPRFLQVRGNLQRPPTPNVPVRMEVYSGWIAYIFASGSPTRRDQYRTFLPFTPKELKSYQRDDLLDYTVTASPSIVAPAEGEATLFGIDEVSSVSLEAQAFDPTDPQQLDFCLVMRIEFAGLHADIIRYTYNVTLLMREHANPQLNPRPIGPFPDGTLPA